MAYFLTDEEKVKILRLNREGYNNGRIAASVGRSVSAVRVYLQSQGIKSPLPARRPGNTIARNTAPILDLYRQGVMLKDIAKRLNLSFHIVTNAIYKYRLTHDDLCYHRGPYKKHSEQ